MFGTNPFFHLHRYAHRYACIFIIFMKKTDLFCQNLKNCKRYRPLILAMGNYSMVYSESLITNFILCIFKLNYEYLTTLTYKPNQPTKIAIEKAVSSLPTSPQIQEVIELYLFLNHMLLLSIEFVGKK